MTNQSTARRRARGKAAQELAAMVYNLTREAQLILEQHENSPPSFSVQLYNDNWTLNSGPKFLYNSPAYTVRTLPLPLPPHLRFTQPRSGAL
jgi:hypothetical protein